MDWKAAYEFTHARLGEVKHELDEALAQVAVLGGIVRMLQALVEQADPPFPKFDESTFPTRARALLEGMNTIEAMVTDIDSHTPSINNRDWWGGKLGLFRSILAYWKGEPDA